MSAAGSRRQVFRDAQREADFARDGYVVVDDFLSPEELHGLRTLMDGSVEADREGLVFSNMITDPQTRLAVERGIGEIVGPPLLGTLVDYRLAASLFVLKLSGEQGRRIWHADPALVDERTFSSVSAWCPLSDVDERNGTFTIIVDSHRVVPEVRGGVEIQGLLFPSEDEIDELCEGERRAISLEAGQALLYDHRLAHGSPPNRTAEPRWAVNVPAIPAEAPLIHYIRRGDATIDVYELPDDYFYGHDASIPVATDPRTRRMATVDADDGSWVPAP